MKTLIFALFLISTELLHAQASLPETEEVSNININFGLGRKKELDLNDLKNPNAGTNLSRIIRSSMEDGWSYNKANVLSLCAPQIEDLGQYFDLYEKDSTVRNLYLSAAIILVNRELMIIPVANLFSERRNGENTFVRISDNGDTTNNDFQVGYSLLRSQVDSNLSLNLTDVKISNNGDNSRVSYHFGPGTETMIQSRLAWRKIRNKEVKFNCENMKKIEAILN